MESNKESRYYKTINKFIILNLVVLLYSCSIIETNYPKGKPETYNISDYSSINLYENSTFEISSKMMGKTTGSYEKYKDTIYLTSKYQKDTIKLDSVRFELKEEYSKDSICVQYYLSGTRSVPPVYVTFYDDDENTFRFDYPFDKAIVNSKFTKFKLNFENSSSKLILFPKKPFNYLFFTFDYTSHPQYYFFMNNDKFLIKGSKLIKIDNTPN